MTTTRSRHAAAAALVLLLAGPQAAFGEKPDIVLQPHRAIYDMALLRSSASTDVGAISGRMVFEFTGSACEGYTVNSRFVTLLDNNEGERRVTDLRLSTYETIDPDTLQFFNQTYVDDRLGEEVKGTATRTDEGIEVALSEPDALEQAIETDAVFPTEHIIAQIAAAKAGDTFLDVDLFDGTDDGVSLFATTAVLGKPKQGVADVGFDHEEALAALGEDQTYWPVNLSYFDKTDERVDATPKYELHYFLYDNGVSRNLTLDYGTFALSGGLTELEYLDAEPCD